MNTGTDSGWIIERLGALRMSPAEREAATSCLRQGALLANLMIPTIAFIRSTGDRIGRALRRPVQLNH